MRASHRYSACACMNYVRAPEAKGMTPSTQFDTRGSTMLHLVAMGIGLILTAGGCTSADEGRRSGDRDTATAERDGATASDGAAEEDADRDDDESQQDGSSSEEPDASESEGEDAQAIGDGGASPLADAAGGPGALDGSTDGSRTDGSRGDSDASAAAPRYACGTGWPMPYPPGSSEPNATTFVKEPTGVVVDSVTGLAWALETARFHAIQDAVSFCENLSAGGVDDWRVPLLVELGSLIDYTAVRPFYAAVFPRFAPENGAAVSYHGFWARSTTPQLAWVVNFDSGAFSLHGNSFDTRQPGAAVRVMCVRTAAVKDPRPASCDERSTNTETWMDKTWPSIVKHNVSGLSWHRRAGSLQYAPALDYCARFGDGKWRIPTTAEFSTLVEGTGSAGDPVFGFYTDVFTAWVRSPFGATGSPLVFSTKPISFVSVTPTNLDGVLCVRSAP